MSKRRTRVRLGGVLAASALLAACAVAPHKPAPRPATVITHPQPPTPTIAPLAPAPSAGEPWASLVASFVMDDCNDSPLVHDKIAMYTRSPAHFEDMLRHALPLMMYVQKRLAASSVPGEFVMLPMLESSYNISETSRRGDPAGMWQLMPHTARVHGLTIDQTYDGRLDPVASTRVAIGMLKTFDQQFGNWRLADLAYNAGSGAVADALHGHKDPGDSVIPDIGLSAISRKHLAKLMALSCIVREPQRFHVQLPKPTAADRLQAIDVPKGLELRDIAEMAEVPESDLRALNAGYRGSRIPAHSPGKLLLPTTAATTLAAALDANASGTVAQAGAHDQGTGSNSGVRTPEESDPQAADDSGARADAGRSHVVRRGETLWSIARRYHVTIGELKRWNHLGGEAIRPGEELRVDGAEAGH